MTRIVASFALAALLAPLAHAAPASAGRTRTEALIAAFGKVKDGAGLSAADKAANEKAFAALDEYFDYATLTAEPIKPTLDKFKPDELASFKPKFRELIRLIAYPNAGAFFRTAKLTWLPETKKGEQVSVPIKVSVEEEDVEMTVAFVWATVGGALRIQDVLFDGDSLVKDYQAQIAKVVGKSGVAGLFKALDDRKAELEKAK